MIKISKYLVILIILNMFRLWGFKTNKIYKHVIILNKYTILHILMIQRAWDSGSLFQFKCLKYVKHFKALEI